MKTLSTRPFSAELQLMAQSGEQPADQQTQTPQSARRPAAFGGQSEILQAIAELRKELFSQNAQGSGTAENAPTSTEVSDADFRQIHEARMLKAEIEKLSKAIETTKLEIASLRYKDKKYERIADVTTELDEVVGDTEIATETILNCCEEIDRHVEVIELQASSPEERAEIAALSEKVTKIFEACNFQDITGQRITKVVNALKYIEERVEVMMSIWGGTEAFANI
ncbi:unnamed protein product, partial [Phaeothamnion confervicola]